MKKKNVLNAKYRVTMKPNPARQAALYSFLLMRGNKWTSMEEVTDSISLYPAFFRSYYHNSNARRMLSFDISQINRSSEYDKLIISNSRGIKLATESESHTFLKNEIREIFRKLAGVRAMIRKMRRNNQIDLEGQIAEAFLQEGKDG